MKTKLHVKAIETPQDIATGPNGEPGWVKFYTRIKGKYKRAFRRINALQVELENAKLAVDKMQQDISDDDDELTDEQREKIEQVSNIARQFFSYEEKLPRLFSELCHSWNWVDEDGNDLPLTQATFQDELDQIQMAWIDARIGEILRYRATEGNGSKPDS